MSDSFNIKLADKVIKIKPKYSGIYRMCKDYYTDEVPDFSVVTTDEDILAEQDLDYSLSYLETLAVYRKISEKMIDYDTFLIHGSALSINNEAILFIGKSGTGKSTHSRLWREVFKDKVTMINDDKPLVKITKEGPVIYGTPWDGKHHLSTNISCPLKVVVHIRQSENNKLTPSDNYVDVVKQVYKPKKISRINHSLELVNEMLKSVDLYTMQCNMEDEAAKICYQGIK